MIHTNRFLESAIEDSVQTPDNTEVDLKDIENNINNDSEAEDAVEGAIGDPIDEAFIEIAEIQYNYNLIIENVGIHELKAYKEGSPYSSSIKIFIAQMKEVIAKLFESISTAMWKTIEKLDFATKKYKKFVIDHKKDIIAGSEKFDFKGAKGYDMTNFDPYKDLASTILNAKIDEDVRKNGSFIKGSGEEYNLAYYIDTFCNIKGIDNIQEASDKYKDKIFGKEIELNKNIINGNEICDYLDKGNDYIALHKGYAKIKSMHKQTIAFFQSQLATDEFNSSVGDVFNTFDSETRKRLKIRIENLKNELTVLRMVVGVLLKAISYKRNLYINYMRKFYAAATNKQEIDNSDKTNNSDKEEPIHNRLLANPIGEALII